MTLLSNLPHLHIIYLLSAKVFKYDVCTNFRRLIHHIIIYVSKIIIIMKKTSTLDVKRSGNNIIRVVLKTSCSQMLIQHPHNNNTLKSADKICTFQGHQVKTQK